MLDLAAVTGGNETVFSGALIVALPIALLGGLVSFFSPCVLPLVPGYLSYVTGVSGADLAERRRGRTVAGASLFVLGFTVVFVSGGALFGFFGQTLQEYSGTLSKVLGVLMILMGIFFMGLMPWMTQREFRIHKRPVTGLVGAPLLGALFGIGWTPCLGPTLASVNALAFEQATAGRGRCCPSRTVSDSVSPSSWRPSPSAGRSARSAGSSATTHGSCASAAA